MTVRERLCVAVLPLASVTFTVKEDEPLVVGVPLMTPAVLSERPAGKVPLLRLHVYGEVPPVAASVAE